MKLGRGTSNDIFYLLLTVPVRLCTSPDSCSLPINLFEKILIIIVPDSTYINSVEDTQQRLCYEEQELPLRCPLDRICERYYTSVRPPTSSYARLNLSLSETYCKPNFTSSRCDQILIPGPSSRHRYTSFSKIQPNRNLNFVYFEQ